LSDLFGLRHTVIAAWLVAAATHKHCVARLCSGAGAVASLWLSAHRADPVGLLAGASAVRCHAWPSLLESITHMTP